MNNNFDKGTGGAAIKPSARPSIHSHNCQLACCTRMGRYGLSKSGVEPRRSPAPASAPLNNEGTDEVDNVMSKFARGSSPVSTRRKKHRRNSVELSHPLHTDDSSDSKFARGSSPVSTRRKKHRGNSVELSHPLHTDDSSDSVLAKSLPASLPSHLLCSEEFGDFNITESHHNSSVASNRSGMSHISSNNASSHECILESAHGYDVSPPRYDRRHAMPQNVKRSPPIYTGISILGLISVAMACYYGDILGEDGAFVTNKYDELEFFNDLYSLGMKYRIRDNSILQVQTGISTIFEKQDTGSFIFTYNSNTKYYNPVEFDKFIETLASTASKYLRNDSASAQHIVLDGSKLEMRSSSELVNKYREDISKTGLMLVKDLDQVPSTLAMAFHYYCDEYNPIAKRTAIFFTLDMAKCSSVPANQKPTHAFIEKCLAKKWSSVSKDNIGPLLTRVVNVVVDVTSV